MVAFDNINLNQNVEVHHNDRIYPAKVRHKGSVTGLAGDWIGVEFAQPVGNTTGLFRGQRYFQTKNNFGLFTTANKIRFGVTCRKSKNKYRTVGSSVADDLLFRSNGVRTDYDEKLKERRDVYIDDSIVRRANRLPWADEVGYSKPLRPWSEAPRHHKSQLLVREVMPANLELEPEPEEPESLALTRSLSMFVPTRQNFRSVSSVSHAYMPHECLQRQVQRGFGGRDKYVRQMTVNTGRDMARWEQWNDAFL